MFSGYVKDSGYNKDLGYFIKIKSNNLLVIYAHLTNYYTLKNEYVESGQKIGLTGSTGLSTGEHLHLAIKYKDKYINPIIILNKIEQL